MTSSNPVGGEAGARSSRGLGGRWRLIAAAAAVVIPFIKMINWYVGDWRTGSSESRSLIQHAYWYATEAPFGPWRVPLVVVLGPPLLVLITTLAAPVLSPKTRRVMALGTAAVAWLIVGLAALGVGEDIVFSWIRMPLPLAIEAAVVSGWAFTLLWRRGPGGVPSGASSG